jgi:hypothetical protein
VLVPLDQPSAELAVDALHTLLAAYRWRVSDGDAAALTRAGQVGLLDGDTAREDTP